jgi:hypothetical protein
MDLIFKLNALAALALSVIFDFFFMLTKHDPRLASIIPFAEDPYDSVGSFCMIVSFLLATLSLVRAFWPYRSGSPKAIQKAFLARTQIAVPLGVLVTLACDLVAMARHTSSWTGKPATAELLGLITGMAALSLGVLFIIWRSARLLALPVDRGQSRKAILALLFCVLILGLFPERVIHSVFLHFLAIVLGFVLVAAPQAALAVAFLPYQTTDARSGGAAREPRLRGWMQWGAISLLGLAIGVLILLQEIFGDGAGNAPLRQVLLVSAVFIGAGTSCLLVAFAFLKKPLGLFRETSLTWRRGQSETPPP